MRFCLKKVVEALYMPPYTLSYEEAPEGRILDP